MSVFCNLGSVIKAALKSSMLILISCFYRVSPTDVNSRPSSCLTNFLLSGRSVMLEMPRRTGSKILSHMLTSHGGEIFIHTLNINRSVLEEPPSISEGPGGRVTDYRVPDFGNLMKSNRMAPYFGEVKAKEVQPLENMRGRLARYTKSNPMIISATTIFNMEVLEPLQQIMVQVNRFFFVKNHLTKNLSALPLGAAALSLLVFIAFLAI